MSAEKNNPIHLGGLDHIVLPAHDLEVMLAFYQDVLGCALERARPEIGLYHLRAGSALIDLMDRSDRPAEKGLAEHFCLALSDFDGPALIRHLESHGVKVGDIATRFGATGNGPSLYLEDPEGNMVELKGPPGA